MPNIESMISAQRIICIKRYLYTDPAGWEIFLEFYFKKVGGGGFLFHCNFNYIKLPITLPEFYKECIVTWTRLNEDTTSSSSETTSSFALNLSQFIKVG